MNVASKLAYDRNIVTLFAAGNSGPGSDTHNPYAIAPWMISVGAGDKSGRLAGFSSRGVKDEEGTFVMGGKIWTYKNKPTIVAPGVDLISTRVVAPVTTLAAEKDVNELEPEHVPYYTHMSGTSMATPHAAGIVALLLEANPSLSVDEVKAIFEQTATNMPGRESWEVGAGYVNAYAAVDRVFRSSAAYGSTLNMNRTFNSNVNTNEETKAMKIDFNPVTPATNSKKFNVVEGTTGFEARIRTTGAAGETGNLVNLILTSPSGKEYRSGIPVLFAISFDRIVAVASREAGTWTFEARGLEGAAVPEEIKGSVTIMTAAGTTGLNDIVDHPAEDAIKMAVNSRLADGLANGFAPDEKLTRIDLADYLMMGGGVRQFLPVDGTFTLNDVEDAKKLLVESIVAKGAALRDKEHKLDGIMRTLTAGTFAAEGTVNRAELAYSLVQILGFQKEAIERNGQTPTVKVDGESYPLEDADEIPEGLEGYVNVALDLNLINAFYSLDQGPYDLEPTITASFRPLEEITRAEFAVIITRTFGSWTSKKQPSAVAKTSEESILEATTAENFVYSYPNREC